MTFLNCNCILIYHQFLNFDFTIYDKIVEVFIPEVKISENTRFKGKINADEGKLKNITANIHLIAVDSDLFFPAFEMKKCFEKLIKSKENTVYHEMNSIHGHDAFLMEYEQLNEILGKVIK